MPGIPSLSAREIIRKLKKAGFLFDRQAGSSHEIWHNPETRRRVTIPNHPGKDIPKGTLRAIISQAGLTAAEFVLL